MLTGVLALAGCTSAPTKAVAVSSASHATAARARAASSASTHIVIYSINSDGPRFRAIVTGAIGDYGPAVIVGPDGKADPSHGSELDLKLAHGSFRLSIKEIDRAFVAAAGREPIYPGTCSDFINVSGSVPIVAGSGTGSYRGIGGSFQLTITLNEVEAKSCRPATPASFRWQLITLAGSGTVTRP